MTLTFEPVEGLGEITRGDDIAELIAARTTLADGDVVVVTSKIVSKAAGLATTSTRDELLAAETDRIVARRGQTSIVRTRHGLVMASAGIDNSNTAPGTLIPLPADPDAAASAIRARLHEITRARVAVLVTDTAGRAWRNGQTDIAIGCAGMLPIDSFVGRTDPYGNPLSVTAPAIADQLAGGAELASGKFGARPVVIVRGADPDWFTTDDGPGARALIRDEDGDMFGLGAREAAVAAVLDEATVRGLPLDRTMTAAALVNLALTSVDLRRSGIRVEGAKVVINPITTGRIHAGIAAQRIRSLAVAHGMDLTVSFADANAD